MKKTEIAYMAGLVDGEGCLYVGLDKRRKSGGHAPRLQIRMTHQPTIAWLASKWQVVVKKEKRKAPWRPTFKVMLTGQKALNLVQQILPYLITKRAEAEEFVRFPICNLKGHNDRVPEFVQNDRMRIRKSLQKLKRLGLGIPG